MGRRLPAGSRLLHAVVLLSVPVSVVASLQCSDYSSNAMDKPYCTFWRGGAVPGSRIRRGGHGGGGGGVLAARNLYLQA